MAVIRRAYAVAMSATTRLRYKAHLWVEINGVRVIDFEFPWLLLALLNKFKGPVPES